MEVGLNFSLSVELTIDRYLKNAENQIFRQITQGSNLKSNAQAKMYLNLLKCRQYIHAYCEPTKLNRNVHLHPNYFELFY